MDRGRDGGSNRRASLSGAPMGAPRRPRSIGFKDSSGVDHNEGLADSQPVRFRERPKKESPTFSASMLSSSRNKRTRSTPREVQSHALVEEFEEITNDREMAASDEEDEEELVSAVAPLRSRKLRLQTKVFNKGNAVEMLAVPRKARTAMSKRSHDFAIGDTVRTSPVAPLAAPVSSGLKIANRMKPNGIKLWASKVDKVSMASAISEQEVEVVEALFDLSRMGTRHGSPCQFDDNLEVKMDSVPGRAQPCTPFPISIPSIPSPIPAFTTSSPPLHSVPLPAVTLPASVEAPKRKRPRVRTKVEDMAIVPVHSNATPILDQKAYAGHIALVKEETGVVALDSKASLENENHHSPTHVPIPYLLATRHNMLTTVDDKYLDTDVSVSKPSEKAQKSGTFVEDINAPRPSCGASTDGESLLADAGLESKALHQEDAGDDFGCLENSTDNMADNSLPEAQTTDTSYRCKYELGFDLMAPPEASASGVGQNKANKIEEKGNDKTQEHVSSLELKDDDLPVKEVLKIEGVAVEHAAGNETVVNEVKSPEDAMKNGIEGKFETEADPESKNNKVELSNPAPPQTEKIVKTDCTEEIDKPASSFSPNFIKNNTVFPPLPITGNLPAWPGGVPHMGYYSPAAAAAAAAVVAAAWPGHGLVTGAASGKQNFHSPLQVQPSMFPGARSPYKRCAAHVYIAHFIDTQQQMQRHPLWAGAYGNAAPNVGSLKAYNLGMPLLPDTLYENNGSGVTGLSGSNPAGSNWGSNVVGFTNERGLSRSYVQEKGSIERKAPYHHAAHPQQQHQAFSSQVGLQPDVATRGSMPSPGTNLSMPRFTGTGGSTTSISSPGGNTHSTVGNSCSETVASPGAGISSSNAQNVAATPMQFMQAFIQQGGIPFPFPPGHFVPPTTHDARNHPFYSNSHLPPQSQQGPAALNRATTGLQAHPYRGQQALPQEQQSLLPGSSSSQFQLQPYGETSVLESKVPSIQRNMHSQATSGMLPTLSSASATHLPLVPNFDFSTVGSLGGKQTGTNRREQQSSQQVQSQQQTSSSRQKQPHAARQHALAKPSLSAGLKNVDAQAFPAGIPYVGPGPFSLAPGINTGRGHNVLQMKGDNVRAQVEGHQDHTQGQYSFAVKANNRGMKETQTSVENGPFPNSMPMDDKRRALTSAGTSRMDLDPTGIARASLLTNSAVVGDSSGIAHQNMGASFHCMGLPVGNSRQVVPSSAICAPISVSSTSSKTATGRVRGMPHVEAGANEPMAQTFSHGALGAESNRAFPSGTSLIAADNQTSNHALSQLGKPLQIQSGTTNSSPASQVSSGTPSKQHAVNAKISQSAMKITQSRHPPAVSGSSVAGSRPSSPSVSSGSFLKSSPVGKTSSVLPQKQAAVSSSKKSSAIPTQSGAPNLGGQHHQDQHTLKQHHQVHYQQQQFPQPLQQVHLYGSLQYHQPHITSQSTPQSLQKQSSQYSHQQQQLQQHHQLPQAQSLSTQQQSSQNRNLQHQQQPQPAKHHSPQSLHTYQAPLLQSMPSHSPPFALSSSGVPSVFQTQQAIASGSGHGKMFTSTDGVPEKLTDGRSFAASKPTGSSMALSFGQAGNSPNVILTDSQLAARGGAHSSLQATSAGASLLPPSHLISFSSSSPTAGKQQPEEKGLHYQLAPGQAFNHMTVYANNQQSGVSIRHKGISGGEDVTLENGGVAMSGPPPPHILVASGSSYGPASISQSTPYQVAVDQNVVLPASTHPGLTSSPGRAMAFTGQVTQALATPVGATDVTCTNAGAPSGVSDLSESKGP